MSSPIVFTVIQPNLPIQFITGQGPYHQVSVVSLSVNGWGESTEEALEMLTQHVDELKTKLLLDTTDRNMRSK
jgi:hypothetical protein